MSRTLGENPLCCNVRPRVVELTQHVHQENIENIACAVLSMWSGTGMQLLGNLFVEAQAPHMRRYR